MSFIEGFHCTRYAWLFISVSLSVSVPVPSEILHISVSEDDPSPFKGSRVERVFESDGTDGRVNGISTGLYHNGTLLVTTMFTGMMVCDLPHLMV